MPSDLLQDDRILLWRFWAFRRAGFSITIKRKMPFFLFHFCFLAFRRAGFSITLKRKMPFFYFIFAQMFLNFFLRVLTFKTGSCEPIVRQSSASLVNNCAAYETESLFSLVLSHLLTKNVKTLLSAQLVK